MVADKKIRLRPQVSIGGDGRNNSLDPSATSWGESLRALITTKLVTGASHVPAARSTPGPRRAARARLGVPK